MTDQLDRVSRDQILSKLEPAALLRDMARERERLPGYVYYKIAVAWRMLPHLEAFAAEARAIEAELCADTEVAARFEAVRALGFELFFGIYDEPWQRQLQINILQDAAAERRLKAIVADLAS